MKDINEEMGVHKEWMERAKKMTLGDLPEFLRELTEEYNHDYGTICHAIAAAAVAAAWAVERTPQGGITGFQASAITWEMLRGWNGSMLGKTGTRILNYDDLLFPQYADKFTGLSDTTWKAVQEKAKSNLEEVDENTSPRVVEHWKSIANGSVPFGLHIAEQ